LERPLLTATTRELPKAETLLQEVEDAILEDIYRDIDKINAKV